ncbi:MAG: methyltransferase domain-containing protein [Bryobacteraceae bacterium]|jgi:predicted SAM-dependent methyltransferase
MSRKLHIGGEIPHPDWEILDAIPGPHVDHIGNANDLSRFADGTFAALYASHVLEHFDYMGELFKTLKEWKRVLEPGGTLHISVPDLDVLASLFLRKDQFSVDERFEIQRMMFGGHISPHDYHLVGLNAEFLTVFLRGAGFVDIRQVPELGLFVDTSTMKVGEVLISLNMVAQKPGVSS